MKIEAADLPVVDSHCHPYRYEGDLTANRFLEANAMGGGSIEYMAEGGVKADERLAAELQRLKHDVLCTRYLLRQLAAFFGCPAEVERVVEARNRLAREGFPAYAQSLYRDCGLAALVVDFGYPQPALEAAGFAALAGIPLAPIYRIEPLIVRLLDSGCGWDEFRKRYDDEIAAAIGQQGYRGLKTIIAYRTGLEISPLSRNPDQGRAALDGIRRGTGGASMKKLRDHLLCRALELCMDHDVPMQIHTGMGDFEVNLSLCQPALLLDLLRFPAYRACKVVLVHTGYPYHSEAAFLANVLPRVYCDLSEAIPFAGNGARRVLAEVLELAPFSKVLYGSDGGTPELQFAGAKLVKASLGQVLEELVEGGWLTQGEAGAAARAILAENARQLYRLEG